MKPRSPSKIGAGPVIPSPRQHRGEQAVAGGVGEGVQPFHMLSSSPWSRVWRRAALQTPEMPTACVSSVTPRPRILPAPSADEMAP